MALSQFYHPCEEEKACTCTNNPTMCENCSNTHDRQGLKIFNDVKIKDCYVMDKHLMDMYRNRNKTYKKRK